jgi:molecular chaperone DnaJ
LTFKESVFGTKKDVTLNLQKVCTNCRQSGAHSPNDIQECSSCQGTGTVNAIQRTVLGTIRTQITCSRCQGEGRKIKRKCEKCKGTKFISKQETIPFVIPVGVKSGERLRYKGIGNDGWYGGERGDIYIIIKVKENPYFQRKGNDIHVNLPISFLDAILGGKVKAITLETKVQNGIVKDLEEVEIPAGSQHGDYLIRRGRGCYLETNRSVRGDLYICLQVKFPPKEILSPSTERTLRDLQETKK